MIIEQISTVEACCHIKLHSQIAKIHSKIWVFYLLSLDTIHVSCEQETRTKKVLDQNGYVCVCELCECMHVCMHMGAYIAICECVNVLMSPIVDGLSTNDFYRLFSYT